MTAAERREIIKETLKSQSEAISASKLASMTNVSRQIIVGDIALLRSGGMEIDSTPRGYIIHNEIKGIMHQVVCTHDGDTGMIEELNTMVDYGCSVMNVMVEHPIYGSLTGELHIESRYDVSLFSEEIKKSEAMPLSALTEGIHTHTLCCSSEDGFKKVVEILKEKGFLLSYK